MEIDASNSSNLMGSIVLDSTLTLKYMLTSTLHEGTPNGNLMSREGKQKET